MAEEWRLGWLLQRRLELAGWLPRHRIFHKTLFRRLAELRNSHRMWPCLFLPQGQRKFLTLPNRTAKNFGIRVTRQRRVNLEIAVYYEAFDGGSSEGKRWQWVTLIYPKHFWILQNQATSEMSGQVIRGSFLMKDLPENVI
jgi:hypothetical protein